MSPMYDDPIREREQAAVEQREQLRVSMLLGFVGGTLYGFLWATLRRGRRR